LSIELIFNSTFGAFVLSSYLEVHQSGEFTFRPLHLGEESLQKDAANPNAIYCISIGSIGDLRLLEHLMYGLRKENICLNGYPKIIIGGPALVAINSRDLLKEYPEISYIIKGYAEESLLGILKHPPQQRILESTQAGVKREDCLVPALQWHPLRPVPISRGGNTCDWGRCRFCHHTGKGTKPVLSLTELCERIVSYYQSYGWRYFYIYDNYLKPDELIEILKQLDAAKIRPTLDIFGMRVVKDAVKLAKPLKRTNMVRSIGWGIEMYSQRMLNLYRKGIRIEDVLPVLEAAKEGGVKSTGYILTGLPGTMSEDYWQTYEFCCDHIGKDKVLAEIIVNWFLVNSNLKRRLKTPEIRIRPKKVYKVNRYFGNDNELMNVKTNFYDFDSWDHFSQKWQSREESFLLNEEVLRRLFRIKGVLYDHRAFFLEPSVWQKFWGNEYAQWIKGHVAAIPPVN